MDGGDPGEMVRSGVGTASSSGRSGCPPETRAGSVIRLSAIPPGATRAGEMALGGLGACQNAPGGLERRGRCVRGLGPLNGREAGGTPAPQVQGNPARPLMLAVNAHIRGSETAYAAAIGSILPIADGCSDLSEFFTCARFSERTGSALAIGKLGPGRRRGARQPGWGARCGRRVS